MVKPTGVSVTLAEQSLIADIFLLGMTEGAVISLHAKVCCESSIVSLGESSAARAPQLNAVCLFVSCDITRKRLFASAGELSGFGAVCSAGCHERCSRCSTCAGFSNHSDELARPALSMTQQTDSADRRSA